MADATADAAEAGAYGVGDGDAHRPGQHGVAQRRRRLAAHRRADADGGAGVGDAGAGRDAHHLLGGAVPGALRETRVAKLGGGASGDLAGQERHV